jgi:hypothetical protein
LTATYTVPNDATYLLVTIQFLASGTVFVDSANLVVGSQAADYVPLHPAEDLARCQRYYETLGRNSTGSLVLGSATSSTIGQSARMGLKTVTKPVTPTVTKVGTWAVTNCGQPAVSAADLDGFALSAASTTTAEFWAQNSAGGSYITTESNP